MTTIAISPHYQQTDTDLVDAIDIRTGTKRPIASLDTKILVFQDRVKGWFLDIARGLCEKDGNSGYIVLQIAASQIEGTQQYFEGTSSEGQSKKAFVRGMKRVFGPQAMGHDALLEDFYSRVRCGLFHDGFTKANVGISWGVGFPVSFGGGGIMVNPRMFLAAVDASVEEYVKQLQDPSNQDLRKKFETRWDAV